jgi:hypothetical protein
MEIPGLDGVEVFFGDAERPLPNWREILPEDDSDGDELTPEEREAVIGMIGFDPAEKEEEPTPPKIGPSPFASRKSLNYRTKGWITIGGEPAQHGGRSEQHHGGTPVELDSSGKIKKGPQALKGKKPSELKKPAAKVGPSPMVERPKVEPPKTDTKEEKKPDPSKAKASLTGERTERVKSVLSKLFGKQKDYGSVIASIVAAPDDAKVDYYRGEGDSVVIDIENKDFFMSCQINSENNKDGLYLDAFFGKAGAKGKGVGSHVFANQVEQCRAAGLKSIKCWAAGKPGGDMNGYYTWPRMGFDQEIDPNTDYDWKGDPVEKFPNAKSVQDIMKTREGREWWKANGGNLHNAKFDLSDGSRSMQVFNAYMEERKARNG